MFEQETGVKITVVQEPWGSYQNKVLGRMGRPRHRLRHGRRRLPVDRPGRHRRPLRRHDRLHEVERPGQDTVTEATLKYYGEYPPGSGKYYAYPTEGDANGWAYRKDIVENDKEKADFKAKYGYDYTIPPKDYKMFVDMSEFFSPARRQPAHVRRRRLHPEGLRRHHHGLPERLLHLRLRLEQGLEGRGRG